MPKDIVSSPKFRQLFNNCMVVIEDERRLKGLTKSITASVIGNPNLSLDQYSRYVNTEHPATPDVDIFFELCAAVGLKPETVIARARKMMDIE